MQARRLHHCGAPTHAEQRALARVRAGKHPIPRRNDDMIDVAQGSTDALADSADRVGLFAVRVLDEAIAGLDAPTTALDLRQPSGVVMEEAVRAARASGLSGFDCDDTIAAVREAWARAAV